VPNDPRSPIVTSGLRIGTPAGDHARLRAPEIEQLAGWIADVLDAKRQCRTFAAIRGEVIELCARFPVYGQ
jgi:glycine hydroxymethyltransferase